MAKTFTDLKGNIITIPERPIDIDLDCDTDIITDEITAYTVTIGGEYTYRVSEEVYKAIEKFLK